MKRLTLALLLALAACAAPDTRPPVQTVAAVELDRYLGTWHEIARLANRFEDNASLDCVHVTATYRLRPDGRLGVRNACRNALDGMAQRGVDGQAYAVEGSNNTRLRVSFFWPFFGDYWVVGLAPDYSWAVVGNPRRDYLWVLSRTPTMAPEVYARAVGTAAAQGFDVAKLRMVPTAVD